MNTERFGSWLTEASVAQGTWAYNDEFTDEFVAENREANLFVSVDMAGWVECGNCYPVAGSNGGLSYITTIEARMGRRASGAVMYLLRAGAQFLKAAVREAVKAGALNMENERWNGA